LKIETLPLAERKTTFKEVELGFSKEQAVAEANRCIQCKSPSCVKGCPAHINIPKFLKLFREGDIESAAMTIRESNFFPSICGRICQHENQCEGNCILNLTKKEPVLIGSIERYVGDNASFPKKEAKANGKKAAVIGSGPSGLTAAALLAMKGISVTVFERSNSFGGVIKYGVPDFRLPKEIIFKELSSLQKLGIEFEPNTQIDEKTLDEFSKKFDVIFLGTGVGAPRKLNVPGEELKGVMPAMKLLINLNQNSMPMITPGEKVVVVGAGYVGLDAARVAVRLGADVTCISKAKKEEAIKFVSPKDYVEAEEEGVKILYGFEVKGFEGSDKLEKVVYVNGDKVDRVLLVDKAIIAVGQTHDDDSMKNKLCTDMNGKIITTDFFQTKILNVFAAGDCTHGPKTVIHAITTGREAVKAMLAYLERPESIKQKLETDHKNDDI
jgi:glutamate synthase (NADPH/NADH) small chain